MLTSATPLLILVAAVICPKVVTSFANLASSPYPHEISTRASSQSLFAASASTQQTSDELLCLLTEKADNASTESDDSRINRLVQNLISSRSSFNPSTCIEGPLFASVHFIGSTPLWEKIAAGAVRNVKGQKYREDGTFTNYAEVLGENLYLKAIGGYSDIGPVRAVESDANPFSSFASLFANEQSTLLPTPYDYEARVTGASISLWNKFELNLSIEGTGIVRVLYADENLRIFLSPTDTNVTKGAGDWESEGLIVVQVRVGLVYDDWEDKL